MTKSLYSSSSTRPLLTERKTKLPCMNIFNTFEYANINFGFDQLHHCAAPVMWGNVRPWATMLGSNVLLWFEACIFMILTLDGKIFREKVR